MDPIEAIIETLDRLEVELYTQRVLLEKLAVDLNDGEAPGNGRGLS
jgi:hypothetical protein